MQIFIVGSIIETALSLDKRRFHRQISEAKIVQRAIKGENKWKGPLIEMYRYNYTWLSMYILVFEAIRNGDLAFAQYISEQAELISPKFFCEEYFNNMKSRLYTKDENYYKKWSDLGKSDVNMYWVDYEWRFIPQKKEA